MVTNNALEDWLAEPHEGPSQRSLALPLGEADAIAPAPLDARVTSLQSSLPPLLRLGTSSWYFPGWRGWVWGERYTQSALSRHGLTAYSKHPLLRTVSIDRAYYRPLAAVDYARYAAQVGDDFRFMVKAPSVVCTATQRLEGAEHPNPHFLDPQLARSAFIEPALQGLSTKAAVLVFQFSPLPHHLLADPDAFCARLEVFMLALPPTPGALFAVELRDASLLRPRLVDALKRTGWHLCLGLHARLPDIEDQLPLLRALWPRPLICRWSLHRGTAYEQARRNWHPFDRLAAPDVHTRDVLARVAAATLAKDLPVFVTINNKAEGSAPLSVIELAASISAQLCSGATSQRSASVRA